MAPGEKISRLILVSNRLPFMIDVSKGVPEYKPSAGGLIQGLKEIHKEPHVYWVGFSGVFKDQPIFARTAPQLQKRRFVAVQLQENEYHPYYDGMSNSVIWPGCNFFPERIEFKESDWEGYRRVNELFAQSVLQITSPGDRVWIHDYHLMLLPLLLREANPSLRIGYFHHIPFPPYDVFRMIPHGEDLVKGLTGADLLGFHTAEYCQHFRECTATLFATQQDLGDIVFDERRVGVLAHPLQINATAWQERGEHASDHPMFKKLQEQWRSRFVFLSVDRLDYSKGIPERLKAFNLFLERNPSARGKVGLVQIVVPSRLQIEGYERLLEEIKEETNHLEQRWGSAHWHPVTLLLDNFDDKALAAFYHFVDCMLVTPMRDGLNLVCKEFLAAKKQDAKLVLSEFAGAASELEDAILVNPLDEDQLAEVMTKVWLERAEKGEGAESSSVKHEDNVRWAKEFLRQWDQAYSRGPVVTLNIKKDVELRLSQGQRPVIVWECPDMPAVNALHREIPDIHRSLQRFKSFSLGIFSPDPESLSARWSSLSPHIQFFGIPPSSAPHVSIAMFDYLQDALNKTSRLFDLGTFAVTREGLSWQLRPQKQHRHATVLRLRKLVNELLPPNYCVDVQEHGLLIRARDYELKLAVDAFLEMIAFNYQDDCLILISDKNNTDLHSFYPFSDVRIQIGDSHPLASFVYVSPRQVALMLGEVAQPAAIAT